MKLITALAVLCVAALLFAGCKTDEGSTTPTNNPPAAASSPTPADGATGIPRTTTLGWSASDPDAGDVLRFNVYFGTTNPPTALVDTSDSVMSHPMSGLDTNKTYYWRVDASDNNGGATSGPVWSFTTIHDTIGPLHDPVLALQFNEYINSHNVHITADANYFYTINGGNAAAGRIKRYTLAGALVDSVNLTIDGRSIMYNRSDGAIYISSFGGSLYKLTSYASGTTQLLYTALFDNVQAGAALSWDGLSVYAFNAGTLKKYSIATGLVTQTLTGLSYGAGSGDATVVAVDDQNIYTWSSSIRTVYVYSLSGVFRRNLVLSAGDWGYSLSYVNGYLFVAHDGNGATGTWYGFNIRRITGSSITPAAEYKVSPQPAAAAAFRKGDTTQ